MFSLMSHETLDCNEQKSIKTQKPKKANKEMVVDLIIKN